MTPAMTILFVTSTFVRAAIVAVRGAFSGIDQTSWMVLPGFQFHVEKPGRPLVEEGIVPGGGVALLRTIPALEKLAFEQFSSVSHRRRQTGR